ncbi:MAG TPA: ATP-binding protein [Terriglobia bacterium]|nr:ATP-binding protein [Terriglobia bacterium]
MSRIRTRLILAFLLATLLPLIVTVWIMTTLLEQSLDYATTAQLDRLSMSLQETGRHYYQQARDNLRQEAQSGTLPHETFRKPDEGHWPAEIADFWQSREPERFVIAGPGGNRLDYYMRREEEVWRYSRDLGAVHMDDLSREYRDARQLVQKSRERDLRRGFTTTLIVLVAAVWIVAFVWLVYLANRVSRPMQQLAAGLGELAAGRLETRILAESDDEIGRAIAAFNRSAAELQHSRDRLVYLTQIASWQTLARKMAHELKNSLTPIRLTVEEILARQPESERPFMTQAARIVVDEIEALERRVRAFSDFSAEPALKLAPLDINAILKERISFLKSAHPDIRYQTDIDVQLPRALCDSDRVKGILTNLLENAADAAGANGFILSHSYASLDSVVVEIHDSGPGLSEESMKTLFEPSISFKNRGMGLGLSIARKDALVCNGDLGLIPGRLGGAGFRLTLPKA